MKKKIVSFCLGVFLAIPLAASEENAKNVGNSASLLLAKTLMAELRKQMKEKKTEEAVDFCSKEAMKITNSMGDLLPEGVKIRRISDKARNSHNLPNQQDVELLKKFSDMQLQGQPLKKAYHLSRVKNGYIFYKPLLVGKECLQCHGSEKEIHPAVLTAISKHYPDDRATGYREGDLRGMVVVDITEGACN